MRQTDRRGRRGRQTRQPDKKQSKAKQSKKLSFLPFYLTSYLNVYLGRYISSLFDFFLLLFSPTNKAKAIKSYLYHVCWILDIGYWIYILSFGWYWIVLHCALKTTCASGREGGHHFTRGTYIDKIPSLISRKRRRRKKISKSTPMHQRPTSSKLDTLPPHKDLQSAI